LGKNSRILNFEKKPAYRSFISVSLLEKVLKEIEIGFAAFNKDFTVTKM